MGGGIAPRGRFLATFGIVVAIAGGMAASASAAPPGVLETWVEGVSTSGAVFRARVDGGGISSLYRFDYITAALYQTNVDAGKDGFLGAAKVPDPEENPGSGVNPVSKEVKNLQPDTKYRYRIVVNNKDGTAIGPERVLTTKGPGGPLALLDGRGWEMVSPVDKNGGEIQGPGANAGGGVFQAAAQGGAVTFSSASSFGAGAGGAPAGSQYVSRRGTGGWAVENVTAPLAAGGYGEEPVGVPYQLFSAELSLGLLAAPNHPPLPGTAAPPGYENYYLRDSTGSYTPLLAFPDIAGLTVPPQSFELDFAGASPDLAHIVLSSCAALTADATEVPAGEGCNSEAPNLYERSAAGWRLLNEAPPARLAAPAGATSSDGSRIYWTDGSNLYLNEAGTGMVQVDEAQGGGGAFQAASNDGSVVLFTKVGNLYRYDVGTEATANLTPGGGVLGVLGASADGSSVYYATAAGLFLSRGGSTTGPLIPAVDPSNFPPSTGTARVSADGNRLAFVSSAELPSYDNTLNGKPVTEVYLYDATTDTRSCISCNPTGERPQGPATIPGAIANGQGKGATRAYKPRVLSADGNRLFFESRDTLVSTDKNGVGKDVYEWEANGTGSCGRTGGCLQLISAASSFDSSFVDASADGKDVFFLTDNSLVKLDPGSVDLYDAREGGGFPEPPKPFVCEEDACQPLPSAPDDPAPGTLVPTAGNPPIHFPKTRKPKPKPKKHRARGRHRNERGGAKRGARR